MLLTNEAINLTAVSQATLASSSITPKSGSTVRPFPVDLGSEVEFTVCSNNSGTAPVVPPWYDEIVLSNDAMIDGSDARLKSIQVTNSIAPGATTCVFVNITFRRVALGEAFLLHRVDVSAASTIVSSLLVRVVPPPAADLALTSLTMPVATPYGPTDAVTCTVSFTNVGAETGTGAWCFTVFASADDRLDSSDIQLGESCIARTTMLPLASLQHVFQVTVGALRAGPHRLICVANSARTFPEIAFENNVVASASSINVNVPYIGPVPTNVLMAPGQTFLARMVAVGGVGLTINASSNLTVQTAFNKVWASLDFVLFLI